MNLKAQSTMHYSFNNNENDLRNVQIDEVSYVYGDPLMWVEHSMMHYYF